MPKANGGQMQIETKVRVGIAALIYPMANAVIFGAGLIMALTLPSLKPTP